MSVQYLRHMVTTLHQPRSIAALVLILGTLATILALAIARIALTPTDTSAPAHRATLTGAHTAPITAAATSAYDGQEYEATRASGPVTVARSPIQRAASSAYEGQLAAAIRQIIPQPRSTNPIQAASSSAYTGQHQATLPRPARTDSLRSQLRYDGR